MQGLPPILNTAIMSHMREIVLDFFIVRAISTVDLGPVLPQIFPITLVCIVGLVWLGMCTWLLDFPQVMV